MTRVRELAAPVPLAIVALLLLAFAGGIAASPVVLALLLGAAGALILLQHPELMLFVLIFAAILFPVDISTGTEVALNPIALLVPAATALWCLSMVVRRDVSLRKAQLNRPLFLFLLAGLFSLLVGNLLWDPAVPRAAGFTLVQLAQWAIFAFSAAVMLLTANLVQDEQGLRRVTFSFLLVAGLLAVLYVTPGLTISLQGIITGAFYRAPMWILLTALAGGQLLFNRLLTLRWRILCLLVIGAALTYCFVLQREVVSNWLGVLTVLATLLWLRWPRLRLPAVLLILLLLVAGALLPAVYQFAGGDAEWLESGGSRLALITRVVELTWEHNPLTGLGPAAYRLYGLTAPLIYGHIVWVTPLISSHNNYVDLFAHTGIVGLALFFWLVVEIAWMGVRLRSRYPTGFSAAYVNGMLGAGAGCLSVMLLADWILPFVYNIGFYGFQASVLVWLFLGGLVVLDQGRDDSAA